MITLKTVVRENRMQIGQDGVLYHVRDSPHKWINSAPQVDIPYISMDVTLVYSYVMTIALMLLEVGNLMVPNLTRVSQP